MSRAHPLRVFPANPALLARPGALPGPPRAGPAPRRCRYSAAELTPPLTLHKFHASRCGSALSPSPPPQPSELVLSFPLTLLPSSRPGYRAPQSGLGLSRLAPTPPGILLPQPPRLPPAARHLRPGLGVARPDSAPPADSRAPGPASPRRRPRGTRLPPPPSPLTSRSRSRALQGERALGWRAPSSGFSRLLSVR